MGHQIKRQKQDQFADHNDTGDGQESRELAQHILHAWAVWHLRSQQLDFRQIIQLIGQRSAMISQVGAQGARSRWITRHAGSIAQVTCELTHQPLGQCFC